MIEYGKLTPEKVAAGCEKAMRDCDDGIAKIVAVPAGERTFENTFGALQTASDAAELRDLGGLGAFWWLRHDVRA